MSVPAFSGYQPCQFQPPPCQPSPSPCSFRPLLPLAPSPVVGANVALHLPSLSQLAQPWPRVTSSPSQITSLPPLATGSEAGAAAALSVVAAGVGAAAVLAGPAAQGGHKQPAAPASSTP